MHENQCCGSESLRPSQECCITPEPRPMLDEQPRRQIRINTMNYGYVVEIGCQSFAIETKEQLVKKLSAYIMDPAGVEKAWFETKKI